MSLYGSIRMAANSLRANQIALQVVGQNIANAQTPGYIREEVLLSPAPTQRYGGLLLGLGVQLKAVVQKVDNFLEHRLRDAVSDLASSEIQEQTYIQLEGLLNELGETDVSTALNNFFASIAEILNQPESISVRNLAVLQGNTLALQIRRLSQRVLELRSHLNEQVESMADDINRLTEKIRTLNVRIAELEGGDTSRSDAVGLRDQRLAALEELAQLINIRVEEQPSGGVAVYAGGLFLVSEGIQRSVEVRYKTDRGVPAAFIHLEETDSPLEVTAGRLAGLIEARDGVLGEFLDQLNEFSRTLIFEFNRVYSRGQGLNGYTQLLSAQAVRAANVPLNLAGLPFEVRNGSFQVLIHNARTGETKTHQIFVDLNGIGEDTTLQRLASALNSLDGLSAEARLDGKLRIRSESAEQQFAFANDTSNVLAALGLNTFFAGTSAATIHVNSVVQDAPATFAASAGGIGADTQIAVELAGFLDRPLEGKNGASLAVLYDRLISGVAEGSSISRALADGARVFEGTLRGQKLAASGVNIDEETVRLIAFQRAFQASARYIAALAELFEILVSL